jgi:membrane protease subunit HflC
MAGSAAEMEQTLIRLWQEQKTVVIITLVAAVAALLSCVTVVGEQEQAVIVRLGEPNRVVNRFRPNADFGQTGAGIVLRIPFSNRWCGSTSACSMSISNASRSPRRTSAACEVDAYARFRVIDPVKMYETAGTVDKVAEQLQPILDSVLRQELGKRTFASLLTASRAGHGRHPQGAGQGSPRIWRAGDRRADQAGRSARWCAAGFRVHPHGDRTGSRKPPRSAPKARRTRRSSRRSAEATAAEVYAESFGKDPEFYDFYRAMKSYDYTFAQKDSGTSIVLSPDNAYLRQFRGGQIKGGK